MKNADIWATFDGAVYRGQAYSVWFVPTGNLFPRDNLTHRGTMLIARDVPQQYIKEVGMFAHGREKLDRLKTGVYKDYQK